MKTKSKLNQHKKDCIQRKKKEETNPCGGGRVSEEIKGRSLCLKTARAGKKKTITPEDQPSQKEGT